MNPLGNHQFPVTSRYHQIETATITTEDGREVAYLKRRLIPSSRRFTLLQEHLVAEGDRLDNITARYLSDPLQFWRICDANNTMNPSELTDIIGRRIRITLPEGIPEVPNVDG